jgi:branched-chain amino acid transport system substrate-binding protein
MNRTRLFRPLVAGAALAMASAACGSSNSSSTSGGASDGGPATQITIGDLNSTTGPLSSVGVPASGSIKVAVDEINKQGGFIVAGKRYVLNLVGVDTTSQAQGAATGATQLVRDNGAKFIFGPSETATAVAAQPIATKGGALFFSTAYLISDNLQKNGVADLPNKYSFASGLGNDTSLDGSVAALMKLHPEVKTAVSLWPSLASYDVSANQIQTSFAKFGASTTIIRYDIAATDFSALLTRIKGQHPDVIFVGPSAGPATAMARQMVDLGDVTKYFFGSGAQASLALQDAIGKPVPFEYLYNTPGAVDPYLKDPKVTAYLDKYKQVNGSIPTGSVGFTSFYYSPVRALVGAMQAAGTVTDVEKIAAQLTKVTVEPIVGTQTFSFNSEHRARIPISVCDVPPGGNNISCTISYPVS